MGENAFIAFGLAAMGIGWQQRLGSRVRRGRGLFRLLTLFSAARLAGELDFARA